MSIALSYVTGTLVKLGQGIERHLSGGSVHDWLGPLLLWGSVVTGSIAGGLISMVVNGPQMLSAAAVVSALTTVYTYFHADRRELIRAAEEAAQAAEGAEVPAGRT